MGELTTSDRYGRLTLLVVFLCLLGGRFTLNRLGAGLPAFDLRFVGLAALAFSALLWVATRDVPKGVGTGGAAAVFAGWLWYMVASGLWSPPQADVASAVLDLMFQGVFTAAAWAAYGRLPARAADWVWLWFLVAGLVYILSAVVEGPDVQGRYSALGGGPNIFVRVMVLAALGALYLATTRSKPRLLWLVPVFMVWAVLSGSRGGLLAFGLAVAIGGIALLRRMNRRVAVASLVVAVVGVATASQLLGGERLADLRYRFVVLTLEDRYASGRDVLFEDTWALFEQSPVFGVGIDGYQALVPFTRNLAYPHNLVLATMAEGGVVGLALLLAALLALLGIAWRGRKKLTVSYSLFAAGFLFITTLFSGDYYDSRLLWLFLGLAAIDARRDGGESQYAGSSGSRV